MRRQMVTKKTTEKVIWLFYRPKLQTGLNKRIFVFYIAGWSSW